MTVVLGGWAMSAGEWATSGDLVLDVVSLSGVAFSNVLPNGPDPGCTVS